MTSKVNSSNWIVSSITKITSASPIDTSWVLIIVIACTHQPAKPLAKPWVGERKRKRGSEINFLFPVHLNWALQLLCYIAVSFIHFSGIMKFTLSLPYAKSGGKSLITVKGVIMGMIISELARSCWLSQVRKLMGGFTLLATLPVQHYHREGWATV